MEDRRHKDPLTWWHQAVTIAGVPVGIMILSWFVYTFDQLRKDNEYVKAILYTHGERLTALDNKITDIWNDLSGRKSNNGKSTNNN